MNDMNANIQNKKIKMISRNLSFSERQAIREIEKIGNNWITIADIKADYQTLKGLSKKGWVGIVDNMAKLKG
jgi:hypothetical protein